ncbi:MAG: hypothetical protein M3071_01315 [Actinomycetota bacterium]|nr:hypothetical protein [Actinomycetota bacterium]
MPTRSLRIAAVPLIAGVLILAGCGSSHSSPTASTASTPICPPGEAACVSTNPSVTTSGPQNLAANLIALMKVSNPTLKQVRLTCAAGQVKYPRGCHLDASAVSKGKTVKIAGEVSAFGVDTKTHTYAYSVNYAPVPGAGG